MSFPISILLAGFMSLIAGMLMIVVLNRNIWKKYKEKRQKPTLYLFYSILGWNITSWCATVVYFIAGYALDIAIIFQKLIYIWIFVGTIWMFLFAREIFFHTKKIWLAIYLAIGAVCIVILAIFELSDIFFLEPEHYPVLILKTEFGIILVGYLVPTFLGIFISAWRSAKRVEDPLYRVGYKFIAWGQLFIIFTFIVDTFRTFAIRELGTGGDVFLVLTWIFPLFGVTFYYLGWILPDSLRAWIQGRQTLINK